MVISGPAHCPFALPDKRFGSGDATTLTLIAILIPSTSGEGSAIFQGASRSRRRRLQNREIKISLCLLDFEGFGSLDLAEIYQFSPSKRCAFDFRHPTFAYPRARHTPGAPALRTCILATFGNCCGFRCICSTSTSAAADY